MAGTPVSRDVAEAMETYWKDGWIARDIRLRAIPTQQALGLGTDEDCVTVEEMRVAPLYNDFLARFGCRWFAGIGFSVAGNMWCLSIQRSPGQGQFHWRDRKILRQFSLVMNDVGSLNHLVAEAKSLGLTKALERLGDWWMTFDLLGRRLDEGGPHEEAGDGPASMRRLSRTGALGEAIGLCLARLMQVPELPDAMAGALVAETKDDLFQVRGLRLCNIHAGFGRAQYLVVIGRQIRRKAETSAALQARYGLTGAEASLAALIAEGITLREAADIRQTAYETARTQLKSVFGKLGVRRQSEVVKLLRSG